MDAGQNLSMVNDVMKERSTNLPGSSRIVSGLKSGERRSNFIPLSIDLANTEFDEMMSQAN